MTSEVDKLIKRYEEKAETAWQEWQIGGSMRHEALWRRYTEVVETLARGKSAERQGELTSGLKHDVLSAKTMDDLRKVQNDIVMGAY